ncbi:16754_t:CDS:2 [Acaulospora morrowiae]|uniref:16754_t:CDS:1 n=1 Tax=Acaulospora morrowiae TaxID=94023 RepID=A0A9N8VEE4_9GLOM|nr:16754_t:CDS:2 [Acaulospora morrowiae]
MTFVKNKVSQAFQKSPHATSKKTIDKLLSKSLARSLKKRREQRKLKKLNSSKKKHRHHDRVYEPSCDNVKVYDNGNKSEYVNLQKSLPPAYAPGKSLGIVDKNTKTSPMNIMNLLLVSDEDDVTQVYGSNSDSVSSPTSSPPSTPDSSNSSTEQQTQKSQKIMSSGLKSKGNSFARVMIDRGMSDHSSIPTELSSVNLTRIPSTPHLEWEDLIKNIENMNLDTSNLDNIALNIQWKSNPLKISHLQRYEYLHKTEAEVASLLRLTPVQYLTSKNTLLSASRRYQERMLPFRKSDAQKMLKMDVNKASKLWEFFRQAKWL